MRARPRSDAELLAQLRTGHVLKGYAADRIEELLAERHVMLLAIASMPALMVAEARTVRNRS